MSNGKTLSITVCTDDPKTLSALAGLFLELSGEYEVGDVVISEPFAPAAPEAPTTVDTAAVFGALPGGTVQTPPVAPPAPLPTHPAPPAACAVPPTPPVPPVAIMGGASATIPPAPGPELDKSGLPWDAAINTSNKAQTAKGIWKRVPKISDEEYQAGLARLRATVSATVPTPPVPGTIPGAGNAPITLAPPAPTAPPAAPPTPTPVAPVAPPAAPIVDEAIPATYAQLLGAVAKRLQAGLITHDEINGVCVAAGLTDLNSVSAADAAFVPYIYAECKKIWDTRG